VAPIQVLECSRIALSDRAQQLYVFEVVHVGSVRPFLLLEPDRRKVPEYLQKKEKGVTTGRLENGGARAARAKCCPRANAVFGREAHLEAAAMLLALDGVPQP